MRTIIKKMLLAAGVAGTLFTTNAQVVSGGVAASVSTATVEISHIPEGVTDAVEGKNIRGFEAGVYGKLQLRYFYVRPHIMYGFQTGQVKWDRGGLENDFRIHNIHIPVYFGYNVWGPLSIEAAPVYNYAFVVTETYNGIGVTQNRNAFGYRAGLALDFRKIIINASYEGLKYKRSGTEIELRQPGRIIAGVAIRIGPGAGNTNDTKRTTRNKNTRRDY